MNRKGFTLVELSIVLVIIGLLISGLLVGQSMITSTKVQAQVKQFQQFDIAVENFKTMYGQLPGDTEYFTLFAGACASSAGDNDGTIEANMADSGASIATYGCEVAGFWNHLSQNGFGSTIFSQDATSTGLVENTHSPELKLGQGLPVTYGTSGINYYHLLDPIENGGEDLDSANGFSFLASEALALDSKMDDSIANTGDIIAIGDSDGLKDATSNAAAGSAGCVVTASLGTYNVTYSAAEICQLRINMLSQTTD